MTVTDYADEIRAHGMGITMSDYRNPEPLFCPPPARVFTGEDDLPTAEREQLQAECATRGHRPLYTVEKGWHCRECGARTE